MIYSPIVPALIPKSQAEVEQFSKMLAFSAEFHLDIVDGNFVKTISWPYEPVGEPLAVKQFLDFYTLEVDLMVSEPIQAATKWVEAGADMLVFHVETLPLETFKRFADTTNVSVGASFHGETSLNTFITYAEHADYIQLMGIYEIGSQGLPLDEGVFTKITELKRVFPNKSITIDGSVNKSTIARLREAGADRFICGSAIVKQPDPEAAHKELLELING